MSFLFVVIIHRTIMLAEIICPASPSSVEARLRRRMTVKWKWRSGRREMGRRYDRWRSSSSWSGMRRMRRMFWNPTVEVSHSLTIWGRLSRAWRGGSRWCFEREGEGMRRRRRSKQMRFLLNDRVWIGGVVTHVTETEMILVKIVYKGRWLNL